MRIRLSRIKQGKRLSSRHINRLNNKSIQPETNQPFTDIKSKKSASSKKSMVD